MIQIPESVFSRSYSAAWITPAGDFIPLERDELTVGDFIDSYGSRETINYFYGKLMGESFVRTCRMIERRLLGPKGLNESRKLADNDRLYRMIVSELRKAG